MRCFFEAEFLSLQDYQMMKTEQVVMWTAARRLPEQTSPGGGTGTERLALVALAPVVPTLAGAPAWALMWTIAFAMFVACKWVTLRRATKFDGTAGTPAPPAPLTPGSERSDAAYLFAWVGMDAPAFLDRTRRPAPPAAREWAGALVRTVSGAALVWVGVRALAPAHPLGAAWVGMVGLVALLHFGTFHLLALAWRRRGVDATPLMDAPSRSRSLSEFWALRWNRGFHRLAETLVFRPAVRRLRVRPAAAMMLTFLASGLVHEAVISVPARGGWGLPTLYFLIQGAGVLVERSAAGRRAGLGSALRGRVFAMSVTVAPLPLLFHGPFVSRVIVPFLDAIGAF